MEHNVIELKADRLYKRLCNGGLILGWVSFSCLAWDLKTKIKNMINFINTCLLAKVNSNGKKLIYYNLKQNRWTNNNNVINCNYLVYELNK